MKILNSKDEIDYDIKLRDCPFCKSAAQIWEGGITDLPLMGCRNSKCLVQPTINVYKHHETLLTNGDTKEKLLIYISDIWNGKHEPQGDNKYAV